MQPIRTTQIDFQFTAAWSPLWLLLLVPLLLAAAWWLYRVQWKDVPRARGIGLLVLRSVLLCLLALILFRPNLILREILTWPGRIVVLVDNSRSMEGRDTGYADVDALRLARRLDPMLSPRAAHDMAVRLEDVDDQLRLFEVFSRDGDRTRDGFWAQVETRRLAMEALLRESGSTELMATLEPLFGGEVHPGGAAFEAARKRVATAADDLLAAQAEEDALALGSGDEGLASHVADVRRRTRLSLVEAFLRLSPAAVEGQHLVRERLLPSADPVLAARDGLSDITGRIDALLEEVSPFPLSGIILVSDGRDADVADAATVVQKLAQRQTPLLVAAAGAAAEPNDIAVLDVEAPPVAIQGRPVNVGVRLKTAMAAGTVSTLEIVSQGRVLAGAEVTVDERPEQKLTVPLTLGETGLARCTVRVNTVPGEVFPERNNSVDVVLDVREEPVRVLFLDWLPRWETRFALNILQRLDYVDLNAIIGIVQQDAVLRRGVQKGTWPQDDVTLGLYDMVVIGQLPDGLLTEAEQDALTRYVEQQGGVLCRLGAAPDILSGRLDMSWAGRVHPLTRAIADEMGNIRSPGLRTDAEPETALPSVLQDGFVPLVTGQGGAPLVQTRFAESGKHVRIETDQLWRRLNPRALTAHAALYFEAVTWALHAGIDESGLGLDLRRATDRMPVSVWAPGTAEEAVMEALVDEQPVAEAPVIDGHALFEHLPAADVRFRLAAEPERQTPAVMITSDDPELRYLSREDGYLRQVADGSGGEYRLLESLPRLFSRIPPKQTVEKHERVWPLWDSRVVMALLFALLTVEWVWRKLEGLV